MRMFCATNALSFTGRGSTPATSLTLDFLRITLGEQNTHTNHALQQTTTTHTHTHLATPMDSRGAGASDMRPPVAMEARDFAGLASMLDRRAGPRDMREDPPLVFTCEDDSGPRVVLRLMLCAVFSTTLFCGFVGFCVFAVLGANFGSPAKPTATCHVIGSGGKSNFGKFEIEEKELRGGSSL